MTHRILFSFLLSSLLALAGAELRPCHCYHFEKNAFGEDEAGAAVASVSRSVETSGFVGQGAAFPPTDTSNRNVSPAVTLSIAPAFFTRPFSTSFWARLDKECVRESMSEFLSIGGEKGPGFRFCHFYGQLYAFTGDGSELSAIVVSDAEVSLPREKWLQLTVTYDGKTVAIYKDGELLKAGELSLTQGDGPLTIGTFQRGFAYPMQGVMDELRFFDRALSPAEVAELYLGDLR